MTRCRASEALVEQLLAEGTTHVMGLVGSAFMDVLDILPKAGIRFVPVRHEQNAGHMADAYARVSGKPGICTAQNGPGVTNMVTSMAAAYQAHSPVLIITPSVTSSSVGLDGFQEIDQMKIFSAVTKYQVQVSRADRIPEYVRTAFRIALSSLGPVQIDIPRDIFYSEVDVQILAPDRYRQTNWGGGSDSALSEAASILGEAKFPVIISGQGVVYSGAVSDVARLAEFLSSPVVTSYLHNDAFPANHPLAAGPIGYQGSKAAMKLLSQADVVLALGCRFNPFGLVPQYGLDFFPRAAKIVQVDIDAKQIGRTKPIELGIVGDARIAAIGILEKLKKRDEPIRNAASRASAVKEEKKIWLEELDSLSSSDNQPMSPRRALKEMAAALPADAIVSTDIGNVCSMANSYLRFNKPRKFLPALTFGNCGFSYPGALGGKLASPDSPVVSIVGDGAWGMSLAEVMTAVQEKINVLAIVFNNNQWGAEKRNQIDFYDSRFVGTNLVNPDFAQIARDMGAFGERVDRASDLGESIKRGLDSGKPAVLNVMVDPSELAEPFRRDALMKPVRFLPRYQ